MLKYLELKNLGSVCKYWFLDRYYETYLPNNGQYFNNDLDLIVSKLPNGKQLLQSSNINQMHLIQSGNCLNNFDLFIYFNLEDSNTIGLKYSEICYCNIGYGKEYSITFEVSAYEIFWDEEGGFYQHNIILTDLPYDKAKVITIQCADISIISKNAELTQPLQV